MPRPISFRIRFSRSPAIFRFGSIRETNSISSWSRNTYLPSTEFAIATRSPWLTAGTMTVGLDLDELGSLDGTQIGKSRRHRPKQQVSGSSWIRIAASRCKNRESVSPGRSESCDHRMVGRFLVSLEEERLLKFRHPSVREQIRVETTEKEGRSRIRVAGCNIPHLRFLEDVVSEEEFVGPSPVMTTLPSDRTSRERRAWDGAVLRRGRSAARIASGKLPAMSSALTRMTNVRSEKRTISPWYSDSSNRGSWNSRETSLTARGALRVNAVVRRNRALRSDSPRGRRA